MKDIINRVSIRMYCIGTGDSFLLKFLRDNETKFTMMIDCGSCVGDANHFRPYIEQLLADLEQNGEKKLDLLVITHEHQDHVNGFAKCSQLFDNLTIGEAWFAWTEDEKDTDGSIAELKKKRREMRSAFRQSFEEIKKRSEVFSNTSDNSYYKHSILESGKNFISGLETLKNINLELDEIDDKESLAGMRKIKEKIQGSKVPVRYLKPGDEMKLDGAEGVKVYVLGPPFERNSIFKNGKEGKDVFNRNILFNNNLFVSDVLQFAGKEVPDSQLPFDKKYTFSDKDQPFLDASESVVYNDLKNEYNNEPWRKIDDDWLNSAGSLALRLNTHINNTSLALAIEVGDKGEVILFPGDAEFGSWESWHNIEKWKNKGRGNKPLVEQLLNNTVFYKVGHHLSYNGTALEKGIRMMTSKNLAAFATLDRTKISSKWKSTMPNKYLLQELINKCNGKLFLMNEEDIINKPSDVLDPITLSNNTYTEKRNEETGQLLYKEFFLEF